MSNPATLTDLAANLAVIANSIREDVNSGKATQYRAGYVDALLDTRATVLAMISEGATTLHKAEPDLNVEHYGMCKHCGKEVKRVPGGQGPTWVHEATGMVVG